MRNLLAAELLKLTTLRSTWVYVIATLALAGLFTAGGIGGESDEGRADPDYQYGLFLDTSFATSIFALLLGILLVTNEFRHGTITRTLLVTPRRNRLLAVKLATAGAAGLLLMLLAFAVAAIVAVIWLGIIDVPLEPGDAARAATRAFVGVALAGMLGAAVGGAVHSQVGALVGALVWLFVAEPLTWVLLGVLEVGGVADYLPGAWVLSIADSGEDRSSFAVFVAVGLAYVAVATALAVLRTNRRDIT
jgi:ABC-2 type transport system permease protein